MPQLLCFVSAAAGTSLTLSLCAASKALLLLRHGWGALWGLGVPRCKAAEPSLFCLTFQQTRMTRLLSTWTICCSAQFPSQTFLPPPSGEG